MNKEFIKHEITYFNQLWLVRSQAYQLKEVKRKKIHKKDWIRKLYWNTETQKNMFWYEKFQNLPTQATLLSGGEKKNENKCSNTFVFLFSFHFRCSSWANQLVRNSRKKKNDQMKEKNDYLGEFVLFLVSFFFSHFVAWKCWLIIELEKFFTNVKWNKKQK